MPWLAAGVIVVAGCGGTQQAEAPPSPSGVAAAEQDAEPDLEYDGAIIVTYEDAQSPEAIAGAR